jgi:putative methionine-R-sulfoxide reductase with GAF domain/streptogramin lyase
MQQQKNSFTYTKFTQLPLVHRLFYSTSTKQLVIGDFFTSSSYYNTTTKKITVLKTNPKAIENGARAYLEINKDTAYLCTDQNLYLVNPTTYAIKEIPLPPKKIEQNPNTIRNIVVDKYGMLWIRFREQGIYQFNPKTQQGSYATFIPSNLNTYYTALHYDKTSNSLFVGVGLSGIYVYDIDKKTSIKKLLNIPPSQRGAIISCIVGNSKGQVFLADEYNGLFVYTNNTKKLDRYTITDGLQSNICKWLCIDANGLVWIATNIGVSCFNPTTHQFKNFDKEQNHVGVADYLVADSNGLIYQPWDNNIISWQSNLALELLPVGKIYLRHCTINEINTSIDSVYNFTAKQNNIGFQFGYLLQSNNDAIQLEYKLNNDDWILMGKDNKISFSNLSANEYKLIIRGKGYGINPLLIEFNIAPPFYKTWWFIFLSAFSSLLLIYLFVKWREKNIKTIAAEKLKVQQLNAEQYKNKLEVEQVINYFSTSLTGKNKVDDALWDIAKNLIGQLGFEDCMIYLWNANKTKMVQKAGFGPKGSAEEIKKNHFDVLSGQGVVGYVMQTKNSVLISDTSKDNRYRADEMIRLSEITVPVIFNDELIGVIDSEHPERNFFTPQHLQIMSTIATLLADKIKTIEAEESLQQQQIQLHKINEQLSTAKLEALRSQMNPHFIFNAISSIDNFILDNDATNASNYLNKFAKLIRNILDNSKNDVVPFWKDWETLNLYLQLEQLRSTDSFSYTLQADENLLNGHYKIPPLIIQPYIENAIHHGLKPLQNKKGELIITATIKSNTLQYTITDNGIGRKKAAEYNLTKTQHQSYGMQLTQQRIDLFNNQQQNNVTIQDIEEGNNTGTIVTVFLKV